MQRISPSVCLFSSVLSAEKDLRRCRGGFMCEIYGFILSELHKNHKFVRKYLLRVEALGGT